MEDHAPSGGSPISRSLDARRKSQVLQCHYCPRSFHRLEHYERHERTHTKEKPFVCACGKKFSRRDILLRHEKLVHSGDSNRRSGRLNNSTVSFEPPPFNDQATLPPSEDDRDTSTISHALPNSMPNATHQFLANGSVIEANSQAASFLDSQPNGLDFGVAQQPRADFSNLNYQIGGSVTTPEDYNLFLDHFDLANLYLPSSVFDSELPTSLWSRPYADLAAEAQTRNRPWEPTHDEQDPLSRFGSRLPSLQPEEQDPIENEPVPRPHHVGADPAWKISAHDHKKIKASLEEFASVLPADFVLPSRHALSQFIEGYIGGFHQHLPFLHSPTLVASDCPPELLLAMVAVGAQYRFESNKGNKLWFAARAIAFEQIRRRHSQKVAVITSLPTPRSSLAAKSPMSSDTAPVSPRNSTLAETRLEVTQDIEDPRTPFAQARLKTIQTLLTLMAMGMWGPQVLVREATALQNQLALLVREQGLVSKEDLEDTLSWEDWIHIESDRRTKFLTFCFFNLHSIAYNSSPVLLASEMKMILPQSTEQWQATSARQWQSLRRSSPRNNLSFHYVLSKLSDAEQPDHPPISSLGNYVLIHAIIQQIFFVRQTSVMVNPIAKNSSLAEEDIQKYERILRCYQLGWERAPESSLDPANPYGPIAFSSTALLRLAYIRLHCDTGPCRRLDTREPQIIARALKASPPLTRSPLLSRAILQSAHALSIPVKIGVKYVAHTQTLMWSMQHSLCNLECALFLSKWLTMISFSLSNLTTDERHLLQMVRSILDETDFAVPFDGSISAEESVRQLGSAVVQLWAETFSGSYHVFPLVRDIGAALEISVNLLEEHEAKTTGC